MNTTATAFGSLLSASALVGCGTQHTTSSEESASSAFELPTALAIGSVSAGSRAAAHETLENREAALVRSGSAHSSALTLVPGGPGGQFVYRVRPVPGGTTVFNTLLDTIPDETGTLHQTCTNGVIDVYDLVVESNAVLQLRGPNPCVIRVLHDVILDGEIVLRGGNAPDVLGQLALQSAEAGGVGHAGGGRGGSGSPSAIQSDAQGENGYGPFGAPNFGGQGGESSVSTASGRSAGGGGGSFAVDQPRRLSATAQNLACPEQAIVGLDAENGSNGQAGTPGALHPGSSFPRGGARGPRPFTNLNPLDPVLAALDDDMSLSGNAPTSALFHIDDFWGVMRVGNAVVRGELVRPWSGAGGGGGGDVVASSSFPTMPYHPFVDKRGAGGGAGGGSLIILCRGSIRFGASGRIDASGGAGAGGQNTSGFNRIAGGSGGGSGGHVILQAEGDIDFSACVPGDPSASYRFGAGIFARGGQGGEGANGVGGTNPGGVESAPLSDMLPVNSYGVSAVCAVAGNTVGVVVGCGGDGGPGVIQLHVHDLARIKPPTTSNPFGGGPTRMSNVIQPNPIGSTPLNVDSPTSWNRLVPVF